MIKKNINNSFKVKWSSPPFSRIIKFSEFEIREKKQIKLNLDKKEIKLLERFLEIKSIRAFNCIINIHNTINCLNFPLARVKLKTRSFRQTFLLLKIPQVYGGLNLFYDQSLFLEGNYKF